MENSTKKRPVLCDFHVHTNQSDGKDSPRIIVNHANKIGLKYLSITDHNWLGSSREALKQTNSACQIISGVELSTRHGHLDVHILGYDFDIENKALNNRLNSYNKIRKLRVIECIEVLKYETGIDFTDCISNIEDKQGDISRGYIAKLLLKRKICKTYDEAYQKYLNRISRISGPAQDKITSEEGISLIKEAGGIPVIAHHFICNQNRDQITITIGDLVKYGLEGIEVYHSKSKPKDIKQASTLASMFGLVTTSGSDCHNKNSYYSKIGFGYKNNVKEKSITLVSYLKQRKH